MGLLSKDPAKEQASQGGGAAAKARAAEECAKRGVPRGQSSPAAILNAARHTHRLGSLLSMPTSSRGSWA